MGDSATTRKKSQADKSRTSRDRSASKRTAPKRAEAGRRRAHYPWEGLPDEELLDMRLCDLALTIDGTALGSRVERLYEELARRGFRFRPHVWLAEDWFSPDGVPGIAIPFFLAHPRLMRIERKHMLGVEGGNEDECMRILRHEAGHTIDTAYRLHRRRRWRETFGSFAEPYPETYQPKPFSKSYVLHLDLWYAQSHPAEDFAETFAVWLKPRSRWRTGYAGWPALKKLEYVDELMADIVDRTPTVRSRRHVESIRSVRKTLREYYEEKCERYGTHLPDVYDRELLRLFSDKPEDAKRPSAAAFLRRLRPEVRRTVARWTGQYRYMIDQVLEEVIARCKELDLRLAASEEETLQDALVMLTVQTMNFLHGGHHRLAL